MKYKKALVICMLLSGVVFFARTLIQGNFVFSKRFCGWTLFYMVGAGVIFTILYTSVKLIEKYFEQKELMKNG